MEATQIDSSFNSFDELSTMTLNSLQLKKWRRKRRFPFTVGIITNVAILIVLVYLYRVTRYIVKSGGWRVARYNDRRECHNQFKGLIHSKKGKEREIEEVNKK